MASMRSVLAVGVFGIALFGAPSQLNAADAILSGSIKSPAGEAMGGVMVSAKPQGGTIFGSPTAEANSVPRDQVPAFYRDFLNKPQALNHFQTMNRYWMEDSFGKYGVQLDAFGPYKLPGNSYQYFMTEFKAAETHEVHGT